jgi:acyl dehydratase/NAD(P)-dependent dehydrogenase (short-subunit alcohol dehydrogenase family)
VTEATFEVAVGPEQARTFADLSGDWNPLHTDPAYAATTPYGRPVLHGAFAAGLVSRMAGMHIPGTDCLLHGMHLRFQQPVIPPARLLVHGKLVAQRGDSGKVSVTVSDAATGRRYVDASYEYGRHRVVAGTTALPATAAPESGTAAAPVPEGSAPPVVLVTGATGGLGEALLQRLGPAALGVSRRAGPGLLTVPDLECIDETIGDRSLQAIIHCAWPAPDNTRLTRLSDPRGAVEYHVAQPLRQMIRLAQLLTARGTSDAVLVLVGSTLADPGRHNYRMPLYTVAKSLIPVLCRTLAVELGSSGRRCVAAVFDVVDAGMNKTMSATARLAHEDRVPAGRIPAAAEVADQLAWVLANRSSLLSGATVTLSGGALP